MKTYKQLHIPFEFKKPVDLFSGNKDREIKVPKDNYSLDLIDWLNTLGLEIRYSRYFYSPAGYKFPLHIDVMDYANEYVRLNFIFGGHGSYMQWFDVDNIIDENNFEYHVTENNETVRSYKINKVKLIDTAYVKSGVLVNTGKVHTMHNPLEDRHCFAFFLQEKVSTKRLEWDRAMEIFQNYLT